MAQSNEEFDEIMEAAEVAIRTGTNSIVDQNDIVNGIKEKLNELKDEEPFLTIEAIHEIKQYDEYFYEDQFKNYMEQNDELVEAVAPIIQALKPDSLSGPMNYDSKADTHRAACKRIAEAGDGGAYALRYIKTKTAEQIEKSNREAEAAFTNTCKVAGRLAFNGEYADQVQDHISRGAVNLFESVSEKVANTHGAEVLKQFAEEIDPSGEAYLETFQDELDHESTLNQVLAEEEKTTQRA